MSEIHATCPALESSIYPTALNESNLFGARSGFVEISSPPDVLPLVLFVILCIVRMLLKHLSDFDFVKYVHRELSITSQQNLPEHVVLDAMEACLILPTHYLKRFRFGGLVRTMARDFVLDGGVTLNGLSNVLESIPNYKFFLDSKFPLYQAKEDDDEESLERYIDTSLATIWTKQKFPITFNRQMKALMEVLDEGSLKGFKKFVAVSIFASLGKTVRPFLNYFLLKICLKTAKERRGLLSIIVLQHQIESRMRWIKDCMRHNGVLEGAMLFRNFFDFELVAQAIDVDALAAGKRTHCHDLIFNDRCWRYFLSAFKNDFVLRFLMIDHRPASGYVVKLKSQMTTDDFKANLRNFITFHAKIRLAIKHRLYVKPKAKGHT